MLNVFLSVFFSSASVSLVFLIYLAAEQFFRARFNLRTKAFVLKGIVLFQPVFLLLMLLILISGMDFQEYSNLENPSRTDSYQFENNAFLTSDESKLSALSMSSLSRGKGNTISFSSIFSALITPTTFTPLTYAAYFWFIAALGLIARRSVAYSQFKRHILRGVKPV